MDGEQCTEELFLNIQPTSFSNVTSFDTMYLESLIYLHDPSVEFPMPSILQAMVIHLNFWHPITHWFANLAPYTFEAKQKKKINGTINSTKLAILEIAVNQLLFVCSEQHTMKYKCMSVVLEIHRIFCDLSRCTEQPMHLQFSQSWHILKCIELNIP